MKKTSIKKLKQNLSKAAREFSFSSCQIDNCYLCGDDHGHKITYMVTPSNVREKKGQLIADYIVGYYRHTLKINLLSGVESWEYNY